MASMERARLRWIALLVAIHAGLFGISALIGHADRPVAAVPAAAPPAAELVEVDLAAPIEIRDEAGPELAMREVRRVPALRSTREVASEELPARGNEIARGSFRGVSDRGALSVDGLGEAKITHHR